MAVFAATQLVVDVVPYRQSGDVRDAIRQVEPYDIVTVVGLAPPMSAYFPDREVTGYQAEELSSPAFRDSIGMWGRVNILILKVDGRWHPTEDVAIPFDTLEDVVLYRPTVHIDH